MVFPAILSTLQPFQICIFNRKNSKLTFSNGHQLKRKKVYGNLHASLDSTCKSRISKISTRCQIPGGMGSFHNFWSWTEKWIFKNFHQMWDHGGIHSKEWAHSQDLTLFPFCCVHHHRSSLMKDQKAAFCTGQYIIYKVKNTASSHFLQGWPKILTSCAHMAQNIWSFPPPPTKILLCTWMPHSLPIHSNAPFIWMPHSLGSPFHQIQSNDSFSWLTHALKWPIHLEAPFSRPIQLNDWMTHLLEWPICLEATFSRPIHSKDSFAWMTHSLKRLICLNDPFTWKPLSADLFT